MYKFNSTTASWNLSEMENFYELQYTLIVQNGSILNEMLLDLQRNSTGEQNSLRPLLISAGTRKIGDWDYYLFCS